MQRPEEENPMPRAMILLPLMLVIQGAILCLLLRLVGTSFQVYISGRIGAAGVGLLQLTMSGKRSPYRDWNFI